VQQIKSIGIFDKASKRDMKGFSELTIPKNILTDSVSVNDFMSFWYSKS
jgi:hypothetical protein